VWLASAGPQASVTGGVNPRKNGGSRDRKRHWASFPVPVSARSL
jgi:hypothetical protein